DPSTVDRPRSGDGDRLLEELDLSGAGGRRLPAADLLRTPHALGHRRHRRVDRGAQGGPAGRGHDSPADDGGPRMNRVYSFRPTTIAMGAGLAGALGCLLLAQGLYSRTLDLGLPPWLQDTLIVLAGLG